MARWVTGERARGRGPASAGRVAHGRARYARPPVRHIALQLHRSLHDCDPAPEHQAGLRVSDTQMGVLTGIAFTLFYVVVGVPDREARGSDESQEDSRDCARALEPHDGCLWPGAELTRSSSSQGCSSASVRRARVPRRIRPSPISIPSIGVPPAMAVYLAGAPGGDSHRVHSRRLACGRILAALRAPRRGSAWRAVRGGADLALQGAPGAASRTASKKPAPFRSWKASKACSRIERFGMRRWARRSTTRSRLLRQLDAVVLRALSRDGRIGNRRDARPHLRSGADRRPACRRLFFGSARTTGCALVPARAGHRDAACGPRFSCCAWVYTAPRSRSPASPFRCS